MIAAVSATASAGPVIWTALGYPFEAASMTAALAACLTVRAWVSLSDRPPRWSWTINLAISALALLFSAGWVLLARPSPFYALLGGTGFGALGAGIIAVALAWVKRVAPIARTDAAVEPERGEPVAPGRDA